MSYDDPELQAIAEKLASNDPGIRRVAVLELGDFTEPEAAALLIQALNDPEPEVRREAAKVIGEFDSADIAEALLSALRDDDDGVRIAAAKALADLNDPDAAPMLLNTVASSQDPFVITASLRALKPMRLEAVCGPALSLSDHPDATVRREATSVLGWLRAADNLPTLIQRAADDTDDEVRRIAINALSYGSTELVGSTLAAALKDRHWMVRAEAASVSGKLGFRNGVLSLIEATRDTAWQVRERAVEALGALHAVEAIAAIGTCSQDPVSNLRKAAVSALGEIAHADGRPYIEIALDDADPDVRKIALWAHSRLSA
jgi:HEAT repeat protein